MATSPGIRLVARLFDLATDDLDLSSREFHGDMVDSASFSPDSRWLVTEGENPPLRLWDLTASDPMETAVALRGGGLVRRSEITADGRWLVSAVGSGFDSEPLRLRHLKLDRLLEIARHKAGRELTEDERREYRLGSKQ